MKHLDSFHAQISVGEMMSDIRGNDIGNANYMYLCSLIVVILYSIHVHADKLHLLI